MESSMRSDKQRDAASERAPAGAARDFWQGRRVVVTGASAGLGRALSSTLAARGARVVAIARDAERLATLAQAGEGRIHVLRADVAAKTEAYPIAGEAARVLDGPVDVLINNASHLGATPLRLLVDSDCEDVERALVTNVLAPFRLTKALAGGMLLAGTGLVVNVSSDAAVSAYPRWGAYGVSKAASDQLARIFDAELAEHGVRALAIDPGDMATAMHAAALPDADPTQLHRPEDVARDLAAFLPLARDLAAVRYGASEWRAVLNGARSAASLAGQGGAR
jgi:NAD(P)-dependent dehydrogenase (short-subunit alcohol dehydrogenase family)